MANETKQEVTIRKGTEIQKAAPRRMLSPFEEMDRLFERVFPHGWMRPMGWEPTILGEFAEPVEMRPPRMDVFDGEETVAIRPASFDPPLSDCCFMPSCKQMGCSKTMAQFRQHVYQPTCPPKHEVRRRKRFFRRRALFI